MSVSSSVLTISDLDFNSLSPEQRMEIMDQLIPNTPVDQYRIVSCDIDGKFYYLVALRQKVDDIDALALVKITLFRDPNLRRKEKAIKAMIQYIMADTPIIMMNTGTDKSFRNLRRILTNLDFEITVEGDILRCYKVNTNILVRSATRGVVRSDIQAA